jgi:hypothetical protein
MKKFATVLTVAILSMSTGQIWADGIGLTLSGVLTLYTAGDVPLQPRGVNYLNSANGAVPLGYGNSNNPNGTAVIGSGVEFGVSDGSDLLTIDYTGTTATMTDTCLNSACGSTPITVAMYSPYITGYTLVSSSFPYTEFSYGDTLYFPGNAGSLTFFGDPGFAGASITFDYTSIAPPTQSLQRASFSPFAASVTDPSPVPEPASFGLVGTGLLGLVGCIRRFRT